MSTTNDPAVMAHRLFTIQRSADEVSQMVFEHMDNPSAVSVGDILAALSRITWVLKTIADHLVDDFDARQPGRTVAERVLFPADELTGDTAAEGEEIARGTD